MIVWSPTAALVGGTGGGVIGGMIGVVEQPHQKTQQPASKQRIESVRRRFTVISLSQEAITCCVHSVTRARRAVDAAVTLSFGHPYAYRLGIDSDGLVEDSLRLEIRSRLVAM